MRSWNEVYHGYIVKYIYGTLSPHGQISRDHFYPNDRKKKLPCVVRVKEWQKYTWSKMQWHALPLNLMIDTLFFHNRAKLLTKDFQSENDETIETPHISRACLQNGYSPHARIAAKIIKQG